jgi:formylglycine-generating enzyme required for sulfatase activity
MMGSPPGEPERRTSEEQVRVTITRPFAVGKFAVTFDQWDACVTDGGCNRYQPPDRGWGRGNRPVINVNWADANAYAEWLSQKTGKTYHLLSEAEHEYVTRAGSGLRRWSMVRAPRRDRTGRKPTAEATGCSYSPDEQENHGQVKELPAFGKFDTIVAQGKDVSS